MAESIEARTIVTPRAPTGAPRGLCVGMTAEERSRHFKALAAKRQANRGGKPRGVPRRMTIAQHEAHQAAQQPIIARVIKKMAANEQLPDDPMAVEALTEAMTVLRSPIPPRDKIAAARLILDFTKSKPTAKVEHTVKTAEDLLDEMAEE